MGRYTGPKDKLSRREGRELFGRKIPRRIKQPPGQHGQRRQRPLSNYGRQLREKQAVKRMYGMRERQFKRFFSMAQKESKKDPSLTTGDAFLKMLEMRLDNVVYKFGLAKTLPQARQFVHLGYILVDGFPVTIPSYIVQPGQTVSLKEELFEKQFFRDVLVQASDLPKWLEVKDRVGKVLRKPEREEIRQDINEALIVSYYTR